MICVPASAGGLGGPGGGPGGTQEGTRGYMAGTCGDPGGDLVILVHNLILPSPLVQESGKSYSIQCNDQCLTRRSPQKKENKLTSCGYA